MTSHDWSQMNMTEPDDVPLGPIVAIALATLLFVVAFSCWIVWGGR